MSLIFPSQHLFTNLPTRQILLFSSTKSNSVHPHFLFHPLSARTVIPPTSNFRSLRLKSLRYRAFHLIPRSYETDSTVSPTPRSKYDSSDFQLWRFLTFAELVCIVSSTVITIALAVNHANLGEVAKKVMACLGTLGLASGVAIGVWIRRWQWSMISKESGKGEGLNLIKRVEKLEEDLRSSATIIRVLSRQLEKLGIRFRVTRKTLKEPISETAALAKKNSEATRALAAQESNLEKELGEIQKVLLAMQEQQQKQLELILAVARNGKLLDNKQACEEREGLTGAEDTPTQDKSTKADGAPAVGSGKRLEATDTFGSNSLL